jgi:prepilin-type N-terminal cleavage/methylation domain-containing protein
VLSSSLGTDFKCGQKKLRAVVRTHNHLHQQGVTLVEVLLSLLIFGSVMLGAAEMIESYTANVRATIVAQHTSTFGQALQAYVKDNYSTVLGVATSTMPKLIRVADISAYLPPGFSGKNSYGQNICGLVLETSTNQLSAIVVTESWPTTGPSTIITDLDLAQIAGIIGAAGGGIYSGTNGFPAATFLTGTMSAWSINLGASAFDSANDLHQHCDGSASTTNAVFLAAGHPVMALWFAGGDKSAGLLYRQDVGVPQWNTMETELIMTAPIIMQTTQTVESACSTPGAIANDASGRVLSCSTGKWRNQGWHMQAPVTNYSQLGSSFPCVPGDTSNHWHVRVVDQPTVGSFPRAYVCDSASGWKALGVDDNGNLTVAGTLTSSGTLNASGTVNFSGAVNVNSTAAMTIWTIAYEGNSCSQSKQIAMSGNIPGLLLSCQSGEWHPASFNLEVVEMKQIEALGPPASCPNGWTDTGGYWSTEGATNVLTVRTNVRMCYNYVGRRMLTRTHFDPAYPPSCPNGTTDLGFLGTRADYYGDSGTSYQVSYIKYCERF